MDNGTLSVAAYTRILLRGEAPGPIRQGRDAELPSFPAFYDHGPQLTFPVLSLYMGQYIRGLSRVSNNKWNSQYYCKDKEILRLSENLFWWIASLEWKVFLWVENSFVDVWIRQSV